MKKLENFVPKSKKLAVKLIAVSTMMILLIGHSMLGIVAAYEWIAPDNYIDMLEICFETNTQEIIRNYIPRTSILSRNVDEIIMPRNRYGEIEWCYPSFDITCDAAATVFAPSRATTVVMQERVGRLSDRGSYGRTLLYTFNWEGSNALMNGTASVVAPHVLLTAAHAVFQYRPPTPSAAVAAINQRIHIGQHGTVPSGVVPNNDFVNVIGVSVPLNWHLRSRNADGSHDYDWAFLRTRENLVSRVGAFGLRRTYSDNAVVAGYPTVRRFWLYRAIGNPRSSTARLLRFDMQAFGGQSGGPVFTNDGGIIFAVISGGNEAQTVVVVNRITDQVIADFNRVRSAWG